MTPGAKARRQKRWEQERVLDEPFSGDGLYELMRQLKMEADGCSKPSERSHADEVAYVRLSNLMAEIVGDHRSEAYKMVLERAWTGQKLVCFDVELLEELYAQVESRRNWRWSDRVCHTMVDASLPKLPNLNFRTYEAPGVGIFNMKAIEALHRGPDIREILTSTPLTRPNYLAKCLVPK